MKVIIIPDKNQTVHSLECATENCKEVFIGIKVSTEMFPPGEMMIKDTYSAFRME